MIGRPAPIAAFLASAALLASIAPPSADPERLAAALDACVALVPAGPFLMGSEEGAENGRPRREVWVDAFRIGRFEVANCRYARFPREGCVPPHWRKDPSCLEGREDLPVLGVSWEEASP